MSTTDGTVRDFRNDVSPDRRHALGSLRRMAVRLTSSSFWKVVGHLLLDGTEEIREAEVFSGIGFWSRPKKGNRAEALVVFPGGAANPIVVATRDEDARKAVADIDADSTAMFNTVTIILCKPDGTVEIRTPNGTAGRLPTLDDFNDLRTAFDTHTHVYSAGPTAGAVTAVPVPVSSPPAGTQVLKAE